MHQPLLLAEAAAEAALEADAPLAPALAGC